MVLTPMKVIAAIAMMYSDTDQEPPYVATSAVMIIGASPPASTEAIWKPSEAPERRTSAGNISAYIAVWQPNMEAWIVKPTTRATPSHSRLPVSISQNIGKAAAAIAAAPVR